MLSPASKNRAPASPAREPTPAPQPAHHDSILMAQFEADQHQMTHIKSRQRRAGAKRQALANYQAWLDGFQQREKWQRAEAAMYVWLMLWHIDAGDWQRGIDLARFALAAGMEAPQDFSRNLAETVTEEIVNSILNSNPVKHAAVMAGLLQLVDGRDMADQITAKLYKAYGLSRLGDDPHTTRDYLNKALALDNGAGVKRHLKTLDAPPRKPRAEPVNIADYTLSGRAAAQLAQMTPPAFLRHARKHPDRLPRIEINLGKRNIYRFNPVHVKAYMRQHLINGATHE